MGGRAFLNWRSGEVGMVRGPKGKGLPGGRGAGRLLLLGVAAPLFLAGCATKRDLRDLQAELRNQRLQEEQAMARMHAQTQDSLRAQAEGLFQLRGQLMTQLISIQEQLVTIQELTGQNQRNVALLREQLESERTRLMTSPPSSDNPEQLAPPAVGVGEAMAICMAPA